MKGSRRRTTQAKGLKDEEKLYNEERKMQTRTKDESERRKCRMTKVRTIGKTDMVLNETTDTNLGPDEGNSALDCFRT